MGLAVLIVLNIFPCFISSVNLTALKFQAEPLLTGSCALGWNLKSPFSAVYLWNVLGHSIKPAPQPPFYCPVYLGDRGDARLW